MRGESHHVEVRHMKEVLRESGVQQIAPPAVAPPPEPALGAARVMRPLAQQVAELERQAISAALAATGGNKLAAAKLLGISRAKLYERLEDVSYFQPVSDNQPIGIA
jgi:DNA-binding NtrC family response regulator